jgi:hypothetical protein
MGMSVPAGMLVLIVVVQHVVSVQCRSAVRSGQGGTGCAALCRRVNACYVSATLRSTLRKARYWLGATTSATAPWPYVTNPCPTND